MTQIDSAENKYWNDGKQEYARCDKMQVIVESHDEAIIGPHLVNGDCLEVGMTVRSYDNVMFRMKNENGEQLLFGNGLPYTILSTESWIEGRVESIDVIEECPCGSPHVTIHADAASCPSGFSMDRLFTGGEKKLYHPHVGHHFIIMSKIEVVG
jgi:hypothetical protein